MIRPGDPWGEPLTAPPDLEVVGGDADLAAIVAGHRGALVRFHPTEGSDLARAVGIAASGPLGDLAAPIDVLAVSPGGHAVNAVVLGTAPGRIRATTRSARVHVLVNGRPVMDGPATTVVVANGQFLDGADAVPRGHPGDGRAEVQVYALRRGERAPMRSRLPQGVHLPHPRITTATGRTVEVRVDGRRGLPLALDGVGHGRATELRVEVVPAALRLVL